MFFRPMKDLYSIHDLGPSLMTFDKVHVHRTDFELKSSQNFTLRCSLFQIQGGGGRGGGEWGGGEGGGGGGGGEGAAAMRGCVLYLHGNAGNRLDVLPLLPFLVEKGLEVCCFDFAGCGLSEGEFISLGMYESKDALIVANHLRNYFKIRDIAIWGRSMGGVTTIRTAAKTNIFFAIVVDSAFMNLRKLAMDFARENKKIGKLLTSVILAFIKRSIKKRAKFNINDLDQTILVQHSRCPAYFIAGRGDNFVNPKNTEEMHRLYKGEKYLELVPGDHNAKRESEVVARIVSFLRDSLVKKANEILNKNDIIEKIPELIGKKKIGVDMNEIIKKFEGVRGSAVLREEDFRI